MMVASALIVFLPFNGRAQDASDAAAVRDVVVQQAEASKRHDSLAYSTLSTPDCDVVNISGWWWKSRTELRQKLSRAFAFVLARSTLVFTDVQVSS